MKLDPDAIPDGNQTLDPRGYTPPLIAIKSDKQSWFSYNEKGRFVWGEHIGLLAENDYAFDILWKMGHRPIVVCEFANAEQLHMHIVRTIESVNNPWGAVNVYPRGWTSKEVVDFVGIVKRHKIPASLQLSSEFCLTEEYRHLYPR
uniref:Uncharacterized protein n=1 Tax=Pseudomonas phage HRDY3 TaxID=3236930 RepID=A0AB39CEC9_9VIRU